MLRVILGGWMLLLAGCLGSMRGGRSETIVIPAATGRILRSHELQLMLPGVVLGDLTYAEVNSQWLRDWFPRYRAELFRLGVVRWDERFDCNHFASFYTGLAQACFFDESFHARSPAQALALGPFWYLRADGTGGHAVIQAMTERGRIFIEPQTGVELKLNAVEQASAFLQYF